MSQIQPNYKAPLKLLESPEDGKVHKYGSPVMKNPKPCQAKVVPCSRKHVKWVSPDAQLVTTKSNGGLISKPQRKAKKKIQLSGNDVLASNNECAPASSSPAVFPSQKVVYEKLEFIHKDSSGCRYLESDDKENIPPEDCNTFQQSSPCVAAKKLDCCKPRPRVFADNTSNRLNRA